MNVNGVLVLELPTCTVWVGGVLPDELKLTLAGVTVNVAGLVTFTLTFTCTVLDAPCPEIVMYPV